MKSIKPNTLVQTNSLFKSRYSNECKRVNKFMMWLMAAQWIAGIGFATFYSPLTWIGQTYEVHVHVWAAILLGGALSGFPILWTRRFPDSAHSRHVVAISQMLWSALLIHLSGGRIETHFHVFASLAILSIYRDWKILVTATVVVAFDHFVRGVFYPLSAFGIVVESPYRWMEHAAWVLFEVSFLIPGCMRLRNEIRELCVRQTEIEEAKRTVDIKVNERTQELLDANQLLAQKTEEAEKLALVARCTDNAVVITDGNSHIEWVNEGFTRTTGYELDEVKGQTPAKFQHGADTDPETLERMRTAIRNKTGFDAEIVNYRKNGEPYWLSLEVRPIHGEDGTVSRFIEIQRDISERKAMEVSLSKKEQRIRTLVNNVPGAFYRCGGNAQDITFVSMAIGEISGFEPVDFVEHKTISKLDLIHPDDKQRVCKTIKNAISKEEHFDVEYRIIDRHRNTKWVWERGQCIHQDDSLIIDGTIFDITKRKLSEVELASKGQVIEDSLNEIFIFDSETLQFTYVNRAGRRNLGYDINELEQLTPLNIKPEFSSEAFQQLLAPLRSGKEQQLVFQTTHLRKDGSTYVAEIRLQRSSYQDREMFLAMILDVTERIEAEKRNLKLQRDLVDASRKAGMAEMATGVLHNVGNILNSVNVSTNLIRKKFQKSALSKLEKLTGLIAEHESDFGDFINDDSRGQRIPAYITKVTETLKQEQDDVTCEFQDLIDNVDHIKQIVAAQQSMAKSSGCLEELAPQDLIKDSITANKATLANHKVQISCELEERLPTLVADRHKILQVLINLIKNAKDALVENESPTPEIKINVNRCNDSIVFEVSDNGIGINPEKIDQIFNHGYTTKKSGHGFGLHSSANAATEMDGSLTVTSDGLGKGASFILTLPANSQTSTKELETATASV